MSRQTFEKKKEEKMLFPFHVFQGLEEAQEM
jgi:hypothetical protein